MELTLDSEIVQEVFRGQLTECNDNRYYLMCVIRQLQRNHKEELERIERDHQDELREWQAKATLSDDYEIEIQSLRDQVKDLVAEIDELSTELR